jgi:hypothetical protein
VQCHDLAVLPGVTTRWARPLLGVRLYEDWKRLPRERRREIQRADAEGRAVRDPRDAELAARLAQGLGRQLADAEDSQSLVTTLVLGFEALVGTTAILVAGYALLQGQADYWLRVAGLGVLAWIPIGLGRRRGRYRAMREHADAARAANERLIPQDAFRGA